MACSFSLFRPFALALPLVAALAFAAPGVASARQGGNPSNHSQDARSQSGTPRNDPEALPPSPAQDIPRPTGLKFMKMHHDWISPWSKPRPRVA